MTKIFHRLYRLAREEIIRGGLLSSKNMLSLAWVGGFGHPLYWFIWTYVFPQPYDNLPFRLLCGALCLSLFWHGKIPERFAFWSALYWHVVVMIVLPCIFTFLLLMNDFGRLYMTCSIMVIFFLLIFMHSIVLVTLALFMGTAIGILLFLYLAPPGFHLTQFPIFIQNLPLYGFALIAGAIFTRALKENIELNHTQNQRLLLLNEREHVLQALAGSIAHEMRNPLGQIKYSLDTIEQTLPPVNAIDLTYSLSQKNLNALYRHVNVGGSAIRRGLQIISMILDEVKFKPIDSSNFVYLQAAQITQKAIDEYGYETDDERQKVSVKTIRDFNFIGEETLYIFVVFNIIKNALYYLKLRPSSNIVITIDYLTVKIRDTGPGIAPAQLPNIFEPFHTSGKLEGTGLGLAYCKRVMTDFGGDISCDSVLGEFTEFTLHFPTISAEHLQRYERQLLKKTKQLFQDKRILIVDDDEMLRLSSQNILEDTGAYTEQAENGQIALDKLKQGHYDVILMDLSMPVLDGYAASEIIRSGAIPNYQNVPIVVYTTNSIHSAQVQMSKLNINDFVNKPCEPLILVQTLQRVLQENFSRNKKMTPLLPLSGKTVLVADDGESNRFIIGSYLREWKISVLEAAHGAAALEQLAANPNCDAVLMDIRMPGMDGLEATHMIRTQPSTYQTIPIIVLTGSIDAANIQVDHTSGVDDFLTKPIEPVLLYQKLVEQFDRTAPSTLTSELNIATTIAPFPEVVIQAPPPPVPTDDSSLLNLTRLADFKGKTGLLEKCAASFERQTTEWLNVLIASVQTQSFKEMEDALHFLKGSSGTIGAQVLGDFVSIIYKHVTQTGEWPNQDQWLENIIELHTSTIKELREYVVVNGEAST